MTPKSRLQPDEIREFDGEWAALSNFAPSPINMITVTATDHVSICYPTAEHAYQAYKSRAVSDRQRVAGAKTAGEAKRMGRSIPLRENWDYIKFKVMQDVLEAKFSQNPVLRADLLRTGNAILVEGNHWHDQIWGSCTCPKHAQVSGQNALGVLLMYQRLLLQRDEGLDED
jgi:ribA/ribD-fused uncharacterized protein